MSLFHDGSPIGVEGAHGIFGFILAELLGVFSTLFARFTQR